MSAGVASRILMFMAAPGCVARRVTRQGPFLPARDMVTPKNRCYNARLSGHPARERGAVAQLGERRVRNAKVGSSILLRSTKSLKASLRRGLFVSANATLASH